MKGRRVRRSEGSSGEVHPKVLFLVENYRGRGGRALLIGGASRDYCRSNNRKKETEAFGSPAGDFSQGG